MSSSEHSQTDRTGGIGVGSNTDSMESPSERPGELQEADQSPDEDTCPPRAASSGESPPVAFTTDDSAEHSESSHSSNRPLIKHTAPEFDPTGRIQDIDAVEKASEAGSPSRRCELTRITDAGREDRHSGDTSDTGADPRSCEECGGRLTAGDERVCTQCGLVNEEDHIDRGPEWVGYNDSDQDEKSRVGQPVTETMHDRGLSTCISWNNKDANGNSLSARKRNQMNRLRKWNKRFATKNCQERNLRNALTEIQRLCSAADLPDSVKETASVTYRRALDENLINGRSIEGVAAASTYIAVRQVGIPKTIQSIASIARVSEKRVCNTFRYLCRELNINVEPPRVKSHIPQVCSHLDLPSEVESLAVELIDEAISSNIHSGKKPIGLAAAAVYAASLLSDEAEKTTQSAAAEAGEVCELTIRQRYRELLRNRDVDPQALLEVEGISNTPADEQSATSKDDIIENQSTDDVTVDASQSQSASVTGATSGFAESDD
jgi:transcription initiation factor TFIIB